MECPSCKFVVAPGQAAVDGVCPNCERPYRDQPSPTNSDMEMRNMPAPGMEDSGGNPLQEGILGDYQNRGVRDQSFASVEHEEDHEEPEFEVVDVLPPDPDSIRPDKKRMDKKKALDLTPNFVDKAVDGDIGGAYKDYLSDVGLPVVGGIAGFAAGGPAGAAIGFGAGKGGGDLIQGDSVGEAALDAAPYVAGGVAGKVIGMGASQAAASGSTRGGIGSLMKSAWSKVPTDQLKNAYLMHSVMGDAGGAAQQTMAPAAPIAPPAPVQQPSYYSSDTGSSSDHVPSNDTSDPEQVDFHEKNDGESGDPLSQIDVNNIGGSDTGPDGFFSPDSTALASLAELLPKVLEFALGDQSAAGDPDMEQLHSLLESEHPGYMNEADDSHGEKLILSIVGGPKGGGDGDDLLQDNDEPHDPIAEHEASALKPGLETSCPKCGSVVDASVAACPQCGAGNGGHQPQPTNPDFTTPQQMQVPTPPPVPQQPILASGLPEGQGPNTDEQKAAVSQLLMEQGRSEEIPNMLLNPYEYADELAEITGGEEPPEDIGQPGPPPPVDPSAQQGEMPVPGMAPPGEGATPMMASAIAKYGGTVDGICEPCPNCGSHSTGYTDYEEGSAGCKTCGHDFKSKPLVEHSSMIHEAEIHDTYEEEPAEGSTTWTDTEGEPLKIAQAYDMYSGNYEIPDRVKITAVKPDAIEYLMVGEYGLNHETQLTHEEASMEKLTFVPADPADELEPEPEIEGSNMEDIARPAPGEETDQSTPHVLMSSERMADFDDINTPAGPNVDVRPCPHCGSPDGLRRIWGPGFTCQNCGAEVPDVSDAALDAHFAQPAVEHPLGPQTGSYTTHDAAMEDPNAVEQFFAELDGEPAPTSAHTASENEETGPDWLVEGVPLEGRTAGAHMTPWEQRDYIEEDGVARNSEKLSLGGTHYEMDELDDSFLFGL